MLYEKMTELANTFSLKRPEENYKYIFKKCLKKLKNKVGEKLDIKLCKKEEFERIFYEHYFKDIAIKEGLKIECFYQPRNNNNASNLDLEENRCSRKNSKKTIQVSKKDIPKTISCCYIQNISKSREFLDDFFDYLNNHLMNDHLANIDKKIKCLSSDWEILMDKEKSQEMLVEAICRKIEGNNKCKLPWTAKEVETAIDAARKMFFNNKIND